MCGVLGVITVAGAKPSIDERQLIALRDRMTHRGPDDAGVWLHGPAALAHRRLSVIDPTPAGRQPMVSADGRHALVYNGELYNDREVRAALEREGAVADGFKTHCDTETVLRALIAWGAAALPRLRGMYALGFYDSQSHTLLLARDPLGVKPLYFWRDARELVFASEIAPILAHPLVSAQPNLRMVSAYLTTIRTTLGNETLFDGVYALAPGQMAQCDFAGREPIVHIENHWAPAPVAGDGVSLEDAADGVRTALEDSVVAHLRSDVPMCALLSGGLDSSAITAIARARLDELRTFCAGAAESMDEEGSDLVTARLAAAHLRTRHAEAPIERERFRERWPWMVRALGLPLSTPNEIAIHEVAARLRADGCVVALSGEGADELFAGYAPPLAQALEFEASDGAIDPAARGRFQLDSASWIPIRVKPAILEPSVAGAVEGDAGLVEFYQLEFERGAQEAGPRATPLDTHLRFQRRVNLTGLLQRLDTATMLAGVEGRTPFADARFAAFAEALPMDVKYHAEYPQDEGGCGATVAVATAVNTKRCLRRAFQGSLPDLILERPKASFPLPFQAWAPDQAAALRASDFARALFTEAAVETVASSACEHWRLAWPMINIALWGDHWWGRGPR